MNYADLQQLVEDHLARSDLSSWFQSFVASAETWLNYGSEETPPLRVREMETIATLTPAAGVVTLPADYLEYERVSEALSSRRTLDYVTPDQAERWYPDGAAGVADFRRRNSRAARHVQTGGIGTDSGERAGQKRQSRRSERTLRRLSARVGNPL